MEQQISQNLDESRAFLQAFKELGNNTNKAIQGAAYSALVYLRVSDDKQNVEGDGLNSQLTECKIFCQKHNWEINGVFQDEISGDQEIRPGLSNLLKYIANNRSKRFVVVFYDIKRFARNVRLYLNFRHEINLHGGIIRSPRFDYDAHGEQALLMEMIQAWQGESERKQNRQQVIDRQSARLISGYWPFPAPLGYKRVKHPVHKQHLVPNEASPLIAEVFQLYVNDTLNSLREVADYMNVRFRELGINVRVHKSLAKRVLTEILYTGYTHYEKWKLPLIKAQHEAIIDIDLYEAAQLKMSGRTWAKAPKKRNEDFPLRGFVICSTCQKELTGGWNKGRSKRYPSYPCKTPGCVYRYKTRNRGREVLHKGFLELLGDYKLNSGTIRLVRAVFDDVIDRKAEYVKERVKRINMALARTQTELNLTVEKLVQVKNQAAVRQLERHIEKLEGDLKKFQSDKESLEKKIVPANFGTLLDRVLEYFETPRQSWVDGDLQTRQDIQHMFFEGKLPHDFETGFGTIELTYGAKTLVESSRTGVTKVEP